MIAIPAIDLRDGKCVQLVGGEYADEKVRLDDPGAIARDWERKGFRRLHVVDLDAATSRGDNAAIIRAILGDATVPVQVGGGVRDERRIEQLLEDGAAYVVIGTRGVEDPGWLALMAARFPSRLIVAADVRERRVVSQGWTRTTARDVLEFVGDLRSLPLAGVLVTAVHREGRLQGTDLRLMEDVARASAQPVIASGGVTTMDDLRALEKSGVAATVLGMALYYRRSRRAPLDRGVCSMTIVVRESRETQVRVALTPGTGQANISTSEPFLDHMLGALARYGGFDLDVQASGDLRHHLVEDVAIALGTALSAFAPATCARYGERTIPMDDALVQVVVDLGGRPYYRGSAPVPDVRSLLSLPGGQRPGHRARARAAWYRPASRRRSRVQGAGSCAAAGARRVRRGVQHQGRRAARRARGVNAPC